MVFINARWANKYAYHLINSDQNWVDYKPALCMTHQNIVHVS